MKFTHFVLLVILFHWVTACTSKELSRDEAAGLIKEFYQYPNLMTRTVHLDMFMNSHKELISLGYMRYSNGDYSLTPESDEFLVGDEPNRVACATEEFKAITGILPAGDSKTTVSIEYECIVTNLTPFGTVFKMTEGKIEKHRVTADKYDDGWRISSTKPKVYKVPVESPNMSVGTPCTLTEELLGTFRQDGIRFDLYPRKVETADRLEHQVVVQRTFKGKCEEIYHIDGYRGFEAKDFNDDGYMDLIQHTRKAEFMVLSLYNKDTKSFEESGRFGINKYKSLSDNFKCTIMYLYDMTKAAGSCDFFKFDNLKKVTTANMKFSYNDYKLDEITIFKVKGENETLIDSIPKMALQDLTKNGKIILDPEAANYNRTLEAFIEKYWAENKSKLK